MFNLTNNEIIMKTCYFFTYQLGNNEKTGNAQCGEGVG